MNKKIGVEKFLECRRNEIINKFNINDKIKEQVSREELLSIIEKIEEKQEEIIRRAPVKKIVRKATLEDKRSEIIDKFKNFTDTNLISKSKDELLENKFDERPKKVKIDEELNENSKYNFVEKYFDYMRSEIINKFEVDDIIKEQVTKEELLSIISLIEKKQEKTNKIKPEKNM